MKIFNRVKATLLSIKRSVKRFPITVIVSTALAILLVYLNEMDFGPSKETLRRINMVVGLGIPMSLCIGLFIERYSKKRVKDMILYGIGAVLLTLYYFLFLKDLKLVSMSRYIGLMITLILTSLFISRLGIKKNYEYYVMDVYSGFALTFVYSFILYFGIAAILFTIDQLFDVNIEWKIYYYMFLVVAFIFAISLFLSKLPSIGEDYERVQYSKSLIVLLNYIVIPLITIYTGILYVYFGKILVTREWPRGLVSHLVLWYSTVSVGVIFLITPILEENKVSKKFKIWFPKIILPVLLMMFMSIFQRIEQYGITENRYYVVVLGLWVLGIMIYFSIKKPLKNVIIPISLSIVMLNSIFGPLSSFSISKVSQNKRFESILVRNNMLSNGQVLKNEEISSEDKKEINNIIRYFDNNHEITDIKVLPKDFDVNKMEDLLGFKYESYGPYPFEQNRYFYFGTYDREEPIEIMGYDYYLNMNSWNENKREVGGLTLEYSRFNSTLIVSKDEKVLLEQDLTEFIKDIYTKGNAELKNILSYKDMTYSISVNYDGGRIDLKFIFNNVNGRVDEEDKLTIESLEYILLIGNK